MSKAFVMSKKVFRTVSFLFDSDVKTSFHNVRMASTVLLFDLKPN